MKDTGVNKVLPIMPYNEMWIDCVMNNIASILIAQDEKFKLFPCILKGTYQFSTNVTEDPTDIYSMLEKQMSETLNISFEIPDLSQWLCKYNLKIFKNEDVHQEIKYLIDKGYYVFIELDRYHFPNGMEYQKIHLKHPCLIYGYDTSNNSYLLLESCEKLTEVEPYELEFKKFEESLEAVFRNRECYNLEYYEVLPLECYDFELTKELVINNLQHLLIDETIIVGETTTYCGISSILKFSDYLPQYLMDINPMIHMNIFANLNKYGQLQKRNIWIIEILNKRKILGSQVANYLIKEYSDLNRSWDEFRNKVFKYIYKKEKSMEVYAGEIEEMQSLLKTNGQKEKELIERLLNHLFVNL